MTTVQNPFFVGTLDPGPRPRVWRVARFLFACFIMLGLLWNRVALVSEAQNVVLKIGTARPRKAAPGQKHFGRSTRSWSKRQTKQVSLRLFPGGVLGTKKTCSERSR